METLPRIGVSRSEMMKRVARFKELKGFDGGLPDSRMPGCERTLYNVIGFQPPKDAAEAVTSPVGDDAARLAAIKINEGFNLGFCRAKPGNGPMMHNHDTNETFIAMTGRWRCSWENEKGAVEHVDLDPLDVISFPPGAIRRFENVTEGDRDEEAILMFVIGGDAPRAEFTDQAMQQLEKAGVWPNKSWEGGTRAAAAGSFAHAYGKLVSLLMHKLACIFGQSVSTARLTTSGATRARCSKRANCWRRFTGGLARVSTRAI